MTPTEDGLLVKTLPDGRHVEVVPLTFGRARIVVHRDFRLVEDSW